MKYLDEMSSDAIRARRRQMPVVRCHQVPDAARCQLPDVPPRARRGLGEVSRAPVLMSFVLISGDVLPPSSLGSHWCDDERRAPAVKSGVPLVSMSPVKRFCSALSFHRRVVQTFTTCGPSVTDLYGCVVLSFHRRVAQTFTTCGPSVRPRRLRSANRRFRPWRPAAAAAAAVAAGWTGFMEQFTLRCKCSFPPPSDHGGGRRTRRIRRAARWLWLPGRLSSGVL